MPKPTDPAQHEYMFSDDMKFLQKVVVYHPDNNGTFLVLKRAMHHKYRPGDWDLPGGNVIYGEDALASLKEKRLKNLVLRSMISSPSLCIQIQRLRTVYIFSSLTTEESQITQMCN